MYVDDLILTGNSKNLTNSIISFLGAKFSLKDLGPLNYFLGIEVLPKPNGLLLSQHKYIRDLLQHTQLDGAKVVCTPLAATSKLHLNDGTAAADSTEFWKVIGSLQYLLLTRLDITFPVNCLAQFMHCPLQTNWSESNVCFGTSIIPCIMAYFSKEIQAPHSRLILMPTGQC